MKAIIALAAKDLKLLIRDRVGFFFVFFFPLAYAIFFGFIFGGVGGGSIGSISVVVVDEDQSEESSKFIGKLEKDSSLKVSKADITKALDLVRRGKTTAYIIIPKGFGQSKEKIFHGGSLKIEVGVDPARKAESGMLKGIIIQYAFQSIQEIIRDRTAMRNQVDSALNAIEEDTQMNPLTRGIFKQFLSSLKVFIEDMPDDSNIAEENVATNPDEKSSFKKWNPIDVRFNDISIKKEGPKTSFDITLPQAFAWVFLGCSAAFAVSLVTERVRGTLVRLQSAPISLNHILVGKALACFITINAALVLLFLIFMLFFNVRPNSYGLLAMAFISSSIAFVGVMMLISVLGKTEAAVGGVGWAILILMAMTGGGMLPLAMMPSWMQTVSHFSFVKWTVLSIEGAIWRNFSFNEMLTPCLILLSIGIVGFFLGSRVFKKTI